ncbi:MAG: hypothetical protein GWN76_05260, partial [candidate division Zixibacteria bacterium]|nr:hypothetical protein [candidate division Zixibacteria bacterium]NIW44246.1 hypothetical protein [Gammaproteobacteria bacterium]
ESASALAFNDDFSGLSGAAEAAAASPPLEPGKDDQQHAERTRAITMASAEQGILEPKPWLEKVRKLLEAKKMDDAR